MEPKIQNLHKSKMFTLYRIVLISLLKNSQILNVHKLTLKIKGCIGFIYPQVINDIDTYNSDFRLHYIDHYFSQSVENLLKN